MLKAFKKNYLACMVMLILWCIFNHMDLKEIFHIYYKYIKSHYTVKIPAQHHGPFFEVY
jgi:hypothetical protein